MRSHYKAPKVSIITSFLCISRSDISRSGMSRNSMSRSNDLRHGIILVGSVDPVLCMLHCILFSFIVLRIMKIDDSICKTDINTFSVLVYTPSYCINEQFLGVAKIFVLSKTYLSLQYTLGKQM